MGKKEKRNGRKDEQKVKEEEEMGFERQGKGKEGNKGRNERETRREGMNHITKQDVVDFLNVIVSSLPLLVQTHARTHARARSGIVGVRQFKQL